MGTPAISVPTTLPIPIIQNSTASPSVLTNSGQSNVYVDDQSTVSATSNDFTIVPGQSVVWAAGKFCYAISDPTPDGSNGELSVSNNVADFSSIPANGPGSPQITTLFEATGSAITNFKTLPNLGGYQSIRFTLYAPSVIASGANITLNWLSPKGFVVALPDVFYFTPTSAGASICDFCVPVRSPRASFQLTGFTTGITTDLTITAYTSLMPAYGQEYASGSTSFTGPGRTLAVNLPAIPINSSVATGNIPMWSGDIEYSVSIQSAAACTLLFQVAGGNALWEQAGTQVSVGAVTQWVFAGKFKGTRAPMAAALFNSSAATLAAPLSVSFSGTED